MNGKWIKPPKPSKSFADAIILKGVEAFNTTHYAVFDGLISSTTHKMKLMEFDKIIKAGRYRDGIIKGEFFLNKQGLIRLYE